MPSRPFLCILLSLFSVTSSVFAQVNDNFGNRLPLSGPNPIAVTNLSAATSEQGEPNHAGASVGKSLWWTWTAPSTGTVNFSTYGSYAPDIQAQTRTLAIYTGTSLSGLSEVASSNSKIGTLPASLQPVTHINASFNAPVTAGVTYQIAVDSTGVAGDTGATVLAINCPPTIVSGASANAVIGSSFSYTITASNDPSGFAATGLPAGLSLNPATGIISGICTQTGTWPVAISAANQGGTTNATLQIVISEPASSAPPNIRGQLGVQGISGSPFTYFISATGAKQYAASGIPPGLALDSLSGLLKGTPTTAGIYPVAISASNAAGTSHAVVTITVIASAPVITGSLAQTAFIGSYFTYSISSQASSSNSIYTATNLPPGLSVDPTNGLVRGIPTTPGLYSAPVTVTNDAGTASAVVTITVVSSGGAQGSAVPTLSSLASASSTVEKPFLYRVVAANATSFSAADLPPGLTLNSTTGEISGTPSTAGAFSVPVAATNADGGSSAVLTISIAPSSSASSASSAITFTSSAEIAGTVGQALSYNIAPTGGLGSFAVETGPLPPGLSFTPSSFSNTISGTPAIAGTYTVPISAVSLSSLPSAPSSGTAILTFIIAASAPPTVAPGAITSSAQAAGIVGRAFDYTIRTLNGATGYAATGLPPGLSVSATSGSISGSPTTAGHYQVTLTATNSAGSATAQLTIAIDAFPPAPAITGFNSILHESVGAAVSFTD